MIYFAVDEPRVPLLNNFLARIAGHPIAEQLRQVTYSELFRTRTLPRGLWIFTSLDALTEAELHLTGHLQTAARAAGLPVLNCAHKALRRYDLLDRLHRAGLNDFRAHRADEPLRDLRFPVFVRLANEHNGSLTPLLYNRAELRCALGYVWMRGLPRHQLLVIEFCDTVSPDGQYRKYSIFRIGRSYVPRYLHIGPDWITKHASRAVDRRTVDEEMAYLRGNPHAEWVRKVFEMAHIEYGRLDYGVRDGRPQAWEINLTPYIGGRPRTDRTVEDQRIQNLTLVARELGYAGLREAFERLDPAEIAGDDVRAEFPAGLAEESRRQRDAFEELQRRQQWISRVTAAPGIRSIRPLLQRALEGLTPHAR